jgi:hypothetical protein
MELAIQAITALGIASAGMGILLFGIEARGFGRFVKRHGLRLIVEKIYSGDTSVEVDTDCDESTGYAIYVYRNGNWNIVSDFSRPGFEAVPPMIPGSFEDQHLRTHSRPAGGA